MLVYGELDGRVWMHYTKVLSFHPTSSRTQGMNSQCPSRRLAAVQQIVRSLEYHITPVVLHPTEVTQIPSTYQWPLPTHNTSDTPITSASTCGLKPWKEIIIHQCYITWYHCLQNKRSPTPGCEQIHLAQIYTHDYDIIVYLHPTER